VCFEDASKFSGEEFREAEEYAEDTEREMFRDLGS